MRIAVGPLPFLITVTGPIGTGAYYENPGANDLAKILHGTATRHRMGDVGYLDGSGRLWFCGRKAHRVITATGTLFTVPCEAIFNQHPQVFRSALVGVGTSGQQQPVLCIQREHRGTRREDKKLREALLQLAATNPRTRGITTILFHPGFPVDARHNSKIRREDLATWAAGKV